MKNPYYPTALGLYFNYLVHGMGVILMSLNMASLETLWQTNAAGVSIVISSLGIGRLSVLLFAGLLSDRFGRRPFIMLGMCCYMAFFFGILHTNNIIIAYVFGFLAGMANSFLDAGTYPSLMEAFPRSPGTANILIKAFVSSGQFLLPLIISLLVWAELWFGWSFMIAAGIMFIPLYVPTPSGSSLTCHKENHQLYGTSLFNYRFSQLYLIWLYLNGNVLSG